MASVLFCHVPEKRCHRCHTVDAIDAMFYQLERVKWQVIFYTFQQLSNVGIQKFGNSRVKRCVAEDDAPAWVLERHHV